MIGDDLEIDIVGARKIGMDQLFFNRYSAPHKVKPTHEIKDLIEIQKIL
jgi:FMN phosphatase YigB (HAD superfamily)